MNKEKEIAEELGEVALNETEDKKALTRSIHIAMLGVEVTVTSQSGQDDLQMIRGMAEEIIDKYTKKTDNEQKSYR